MIVTLQRGATSQHGTFGLLSRDEIPLCVTCEDPWANNLPQVSCIPEGAYGCFPHSGPKFQNVWEVRGVPGRIGILIHAGNSIADTTGCILVGRSFRTKDRESFVTDSRTTLDLLRQILPDQFTLKVLNPKTKIGA